MRKRISKFVNIIVILLAFVVYSNDNVEFGTICVGPIPEPNNEEISLANPAGGGRDFNFTIQIDKGEIKTIPFDTTIIFTKLNLETKHLITIRNNNEITESFWFSFSKYKEDKLCLWFKPLYETWSLWELSKSKHICKCKE
jgi:hypothetical protein